MLRTTRPKRAVIALIATAGLTLSACGTTEDSNEGGSDSDSGSAACDLTLAFFGPQTGPAAGLGAPIINGAQLAIDQYNADAECEVAYEQIDSQGSPDQAPSLATEAAGNEAIIGIVGPAFSGESAAAGPIFAEAGLPTVSPSATNPALSENGWDTFHRALGNDATQGPAAAKYIQDTIGAKAVFVIDDASEYGAGLAGIVEEDLGDAVVDTDTIQAGQTDFGATVTKVRSSKADAVFFGGYYAEAALIVRQLRDSGFEGDFVVADGVKDPGYLDGAGKSAEGTIITCPCIPAEDPAVADFAAAYEEEFGEAPGTYAAEAYDAATIFLDGIAEGIDTREDMLAFVNDYDEAGVTKQLSFDEAGEPADVHVYAYKVEGGEIVSDTEIM
ncbi:branched-chain amino acid ABC transporter substrate-binding protein [Nocardioides piscis]|uniref:Branched-chain amino acid ABC transporter substrate-binding protein n=1 Tax=Nocardioides piscis TaxID=2714938 RepID=A0A6G7YHJ7_9ACTN|nr:branched-chain amino acid ABC transporter substrate-binding protein [Nocardioides piscis]QIK76282.1 branched-chain amino acid ABC transporter substrate-binding protein [Nocardioides piscis]